MTISDQDYSDDKCTFRGKEYMVGETRKSGCNTCTCRGAWLCTKMECIEPGKSIYSNVGPVILPSIKLNNQSRIIYFLIH